MSKRYKGAILSSTPPTTSTSSASGVWTEQQFMQGVASGSWPALAGAPTIGTATAGALSASVTFTAPTYTGSGITGYTVTSNPGGITGTGASSPITVSGLTAGTAYTFTVTATTAAGQSSASAASNSVTPTLPNYIEDVYSTYLYTGNGTSQTITNGIDLSTYGGLTWVKPRSVADWHNLYDTARGASKSLATNATDAQYNLAGNGVSAFGSTGFTINGSNDQYNTSGQTYASWTFREQPKFFDVVTYTGNGTNRTIAHNLGSTPAFMIVKSSSAIWDWGCYHRSLGATKYLDLNTTDAAGTLSTVWNNTEPTSTVFSVGTQGRVNQNGQTYVAYLFAHDAGGFGLTGTDNVISCGSYTGTGAAGNIVTLGYEPQWIMIKRTDSAQVWTIYDNMRGIVTGGNDPFLIANYSDAETTATNFISVNATGFSLETLDQQVNGSSGNYIYIAIRRGPMKVPTSGTSVFSPTTYTGNGATGQTITSVGFPLDFVFDFKRAALDNKPTLSRLTANNALYTNLSDAQNPLSTTAFTFDVMNGFKLGNSADTNGNGDTFIAECFRRAPSFMDVVCYTGTGNAMTVNHNLGVTPELMIVKGRSGATGWVVYTASTGATKYMRLDNTNAAATLSAAWNDTAPTSSVFTVGSNSSVNTASATYVAYLFATCAGVSKVGSYTGTGATQTISCGFTGGARFVLVKRTDSTGDWYVWDTARGMVSGTDPSLLLNSTAAEVNANSIYTTTGGFQIVSTAAGINASGGTYIFLAIA